MNLLSPASSTSRPIDDTNKPSRDNCDRRRPEQEKSSRLPNNMPSQSLGQSVTPFLREHIPGIYAPIGKPDIPAMLSVKNKDPNSKFCYRHRPDSKCRKAADEHKMGELQTELEMLPQADQQAISHVWALFSAAPSKHRELMLKGMVTQCCFPQLSMISREVSECLKIDFLSTLPTELSFKILCFLDCASLCKAAQVSRRWSQLANDDVVWHHLCEQHVNRKCTSCGWALPKLETKQLKAFKKQRQIAMRNGQPRITHLNDFPIPINTSSTPSPGKRDAPALEDNDRAKRQCTNSSHNEPAAIQTAVGPRFRPWKDVYRDRYAIGSNWKYGRCSIRLFQGEHTNGITCLQFDDNVLATGSYDNTIKLWDIEKGIVKRTLVGHTSGVRALQFDDRMLVSGSLDGTVRIWKWRTGECINTLHHQGGVITVHMDGDLVASGSMDQFIKVFNFKTQQSFCLRGHDDWVNQVKLDGASRTLLSASDDCTVKLWDLDTKSCIRTYTGHVGQVQQVLPLPDDFEFEDGNSRDADTVSVASGRSSSPGHGSSINKSSPLIDDERSAYGHAFMEDPERPLPPRYMLTGSLDATMRLWDTAQDTVQETPTRTGFQNPAQTATKGCLQTFFGHVEGIWGLVGDSLRYVTGANDATVKVWDPKSGRCERTFAGHEGPVTCVGLSDSRMASGGEDGVVRLYKFDTDPNEAEEFGTPA
ncbi:sulfur controller 2 [Pseudomassariella vexata]|uniref:Sulfur controller 2 n=1 Tax=Pseudomassariella vexata TaxID=1141098 RepID=A0A1Y2DVU5_9PEZI|nr:sulfur controller 2 [Pseudomassariella vexata]ORY63378.1 sulfur controller 2 [Pseudomassariella vexata]